MGISDPGSSWKRFELEEKSQVYLAEVETFVPLPAILPKYGCRDWKKTNCIFENNFRGLTLRRAAQAFLASGQAVKAFLDPYELHKTRFCWSLAKIIR